MSLTNSDPQNALESGLALLSDSPHLRLLYLKLAMVCVDAKAKAVCWDRFNQVSPNGAVASYRDAALALLVQADDTSAAISRWSELVRSERLDPTLARLAVEQAQHLGGDSLLSVFTSVWSERLKRDSTAAGAAFGYGYAAILRSDWPTAERMMQRVTRLLPDDPQAFRELGRIYFTMGRPDAFDRVLTAGIEAAVHQYDLEQELILRGNLGWGMIQRSRDLDRASRLIEEALERSHLLADEETEGFNLYRLAFVRLKQYRYDEALALLDSAEVRYAEHAPRQLPEVLVLRGTVLSDIYRFSEAEHVLGSAIESARTQRNVLIEVQASIAQGQLQYRMGRYEAARQSGLHALELAQRYRQVDYEIAARMLLGDVERFWGNLEAARAHLQQGLELAKKSGHHPRQADLYGRLARTALDIGDPHEARAYYEQMQAAIAKSSDAAGMSAFYAGVGQVYHLFGNFTEAVAYFDEAIALLKELPDDGRALVEVRIQKAWALIGKKAYGEAERLLLETQASISQADADMRYRIDVALGKLNLDLGRYEEAVRYSNRAIEADHELRRPVLQWYVLYNLALAHWRLQDDEHAERYFREAVMTAEAMRDNLYSRESRAVFVQDKVDLYKDYAAFLQEQGRSREAFSFTERVRSRSLVDLLYTTQLGRDLREEDVEDELIEAERRRRALAHALQESEAQDQAAPAGILTPTQTRVGQLRREYVRADSIYSAAVHLLPDSRLSSALFTAAPLGAAEAQSVLRPDEAMLFFNVGGEGVSAPRSSVYVITPDSIRSYPLTVDAADLSESVRFLRDRISALPRGHGEGWEEVSRQLYRQLMGPALAQLPESVRHLHIVPEGSLHYIPFAALLGDDGQFLVEKYTLSVAPSASILKLCRERNPRLWRSILMVADPSGRLPGARSEAAAIAALPSVRPLRLVGDDATQANLEAFAEQYDILHFATHGNFNSRSPWYSHLELHNDVLSVEEIGQLHLNAYLVTLSACETALSGGITSDIPAGDEWIGLNQAFLAAGSPTVMASLWPIDDRVSSRFMSGFYRRLLDSDGKATALAQMQRLFIQDAQMRHPFYWAAFTVIGDPL